jgi:hypothetical protein
MTDDDRHIDHQYQSIENIHTGLYDVNVLAVCNSHTKIASPPSILDVSLAFDGCLLTEMTTSDGTKEDIFFFSFL